jgi:dihydrofolate reductase
VSGKTPDHGIRIAAGSVRPSIVLLAAVADNGVIGQGGRLPWRLKSEMAFFRRVTMAKPVVMGRRTYLSIPKPPLKGRTNIVVSRDPAFAVPGVLVANDVETALAAAHGDALRRSANAIAVIGGRQIYEQTMGRADRLVITRVHLRPDGDTKFPDIDPDMWREVERTDYPAGPDDDASYTVFVYERRSGVGAAMDGR